MSKIISLLEEFTILLPEEKEAIASKWSHSLEVKKGSNLVTEGDDSDLLYFVEEGIFRITFKHDGKTHTVGFGYPNAFLLSFQAFITADPSIYSIEALSDAKVMGIKKEHFYPLMDDILVLQTIWASLTQQALVGKMTREKDMVCLSGEERFKKMLTQNLRVLELIPEKYVAPYLGLSLDELNQLIRNL